LLLTMSLRVVLIMAGVIAPLYPGCVGCDVPARNAPFSSYVAMMAHLNGRRHLEITTGVGGWWQCLGCRKFTKVSRAIHEAGDGHDTRLKELAILRAAQSTGGSWWQWLPLAVLTIGLLARQVCLVRSNRG
jgi:hypothetical protein